MAGWAVTACRRKTDPLGLTPRNYERRLDRSFLLNEVPSLKSIFELLRHSSELSDLGDLCVSLSARRRSAVALKIMATNLSHLF